MLVHDGASEGVSDSSNEYPHTSPHHCQPLKRREEQQQEDCQQRPHHHHHYETVVKEVHPHSFRFHRSRNPSFICSPPRQRPALPPSEFVVEKQGRFDEDVWRTRVLSLDPVHHRLFLSRTSKVDTLYHRCMVRIDVVKLWPRNSSLRSGEMPRDNNAHRTICVKGLVGVKPSALSFATRFFGPNTKTMASSSVLGRFLGNKRALREEQEEISTAQVAAGKHLDPQLAPAPPRARSYPASDVDVAEFGEFTTEVWIVRAMSTDDLPLLARALRRTIPDTCGLSGYHGYEESEE